MIESRPGNLPELRQPSGPPPPMRASDTDREAVVHVIREATAHGMLTLDECDARMAAAYGARFRDDLPPLTADLPPVSASVAPGWRAVTTLALLQVRTSLAGIPSGDGLRSRLGLAVVLVLLLGLPMLGVLFAGEMLGVELLDD